MKLLALAASSSTKSINKALVTHATDLVGDGSIPGVADVDIEILDLNDFEMPIYSADRQEAGGIPQQAQDFFDKIGAADAVLISFAEHNGGYTAAYKNIFDWTSRIDMAVYQGKPTIMLSTSLGPGGGGNVLQTAVGSAIFFGNEVLAHLSIPSFYDNFDTAAGVLTNEDLDTQLREALASLASVGTLAADGEAA